VSSTRALSIDHECEDLQKKESGVCSLVHTTTIRSNSYLPCTRRMHEFSVIILLFGLKTARLLNVRKIINGKAVRCDVGSLKFCGTTLSECID